MASYQEIPPPFGCLSCPDPLIHFADHELPQPPDLVRRQLLPFDPLVDGVRIDAQVLRNFRNR